MTEYAYILLMLSIIAVCCTKHCIRIHRTVLGSEYYQLQVKFAAFTHIRIVPANGCNCKRVKIEHLFGTLQCSAFLRSPVGTAGNRHAVVRATGRIVHTRPPYGPHASTSQSSAAITHCQLTYHVDGRLGWQCPPQGSNPGPLTRD